MAKIINPNDDRVDREDKIFEFIKDKQFYCAVAYAKVCKLREDEWNKAKNTKDDYFNKLYTALAYAFDDPWYIEVDGSNGCQYSSAIFDYIKNIDDIQYSKDEQQDQVEDDEQEDSIKIFESDEFKNFILLIVGVRILYSAEWDDFEKVKENIEEICDRLSISSLKEDIIENLFDFINETGTPLKKYSNKDKKEELEKIVEIKENREENIKSVRDLISKSADSDFEETLRKNIFGENGKFGRYLKRILDNKNVDIKAILKDFIYDDLEIDDDFDIRKDIDSEKIENYLDKTYRSTLRLFPKFKNKDNKSLIENLEKNIFKAIELIYFFATQNDEGLTEEDSVYLDMYDGTLNHFKSAVDKIDKICAEICVDEDEEHSDYYKFGLSILQYTLNEIEDGFSRDKHPSEYKYEYEKNFYISFLFTNDVILNEDFLPDFPIFCEGKGKIDNCYVETIDPEYLINEHAEKLKDFDYTVSNIRKEFAKRYDAEDNNYGILKLISIYSDFNDYKNDKTSIKHMKDKERAKNQAEEKKQDFLGELELSHCYRQFDDVKLLINGKYNECEVQSSNIYRNTRENIVKWHKWACDDNSNYGIFIEIVKRYKKSIEDNANKLQKYWQEKLDKAIKELDYLENDQIKINKIGNFIKGHNFSATVEVFDILPKGKEKVDEYLERKELNTYLAEFTDEQTYNNCYKEVELSSEDDLLNYCVDIGKIGEDENKKSAKDLAKIWDNIFSSDESKLNNNDIKTFLKYLGFKVEKINNEPNIKFSRGSYNQSFYNTIVTLQPKTRGDIEHTIAAFGTRASKDGFRIIAVQGKRMAYDSKNYLVDLIKQIGMTRHTIILLNHRLSLVDRRSLAKLIKIKCKDKLFVVIDRVVMAFLMKKYNSSNINEMLMSVVAPFGFYQPYTSEASENNIPEEVFIGRNKELDEVENPAGPSIVYGGRQLGKSALLKQAEKDINAKNDGSKAIFIEVKGLDYIATVKEIAKKMKDNNIFGENVNITNWEDFRLAIEDLLKSEDKKIPYLLLLIDEADKFFESCNDLEDPDEPFKLIKRIKQYYPNRFKVVFAGLNMIMEYEFLTKDNSIAAHFGSVAVGPFKPLDARELIEKPLHYLGLDFSSDKESLIYLILENTNYYPCLIQYYCEKLLKLMTDDKYAGYKEEDSPIYNVSKKHISEILSDSDFKDRVWNRFKITLELGVDNYYYYLALILALLCHKKYDSYSKEDFKKLANEYDMEKISALDDKTLKALLEQLVKLEVFAKDKQDENKYGFRRFHLFELMGTEKDIQNQLIDLMAKEEEAIIQ